jgi:hypothetical protein
MTNIGIFYVDLKTGDFHGFTLIYPNGCKWSVRPKVVINHQIWDGYHPANQQIGKSEDKPSSNHQTQGFNEYIMDRGGYKMTKMYPPGNAGRCGKCTVSQGK